ncbi:hypothetical protein F4775DRAFT_444978 [Biscogniauxia sp. FL1348]|nr:hypothetical protein F4775DRAFT_444978 [Biscogniauxia sp. FL1348]
MADQDGVAYCPARVDLLSHIQYSNFADIQYLQIHNSEDEAEEGEQAEEYAEGSDMGEYGFDEDLSDVESIEDAPLEDDPAPIPNITEGDRSEVKEDREIRSEKPEKPKEPGEDKQQPKKTEPISPAPKKAKNARKKEESKKKDKERPKEKLKGKPKGKLKEKPKGKEKVTDKSEKSKPKTGKSNDAPKDAKRAAATMETHPAQEPLVVAETPPADDRPNELPPAAADAPPAASHDGKEAEPTPPPESATKEQTEKEMKEDPPQEGVEIHAPPNEPTADKLNEAASGPEQEHKKEGHNSALVDPNNEASNNEPDEKGSGPIPEPEKELDTPPVVESPNESNEKQSSQETSSKPEDSVITKASGEPPLSKGLESATTESTTVLPQESTGSGETRPADAPESEGSGETTARAPSVPADEPRQVPNISPEKDLANEDTSSHPPEKTSSTTEPLPEVEQLHLQT